MKLYWIRIQTKNALGFGDTSTVPAEFQTLNAVCPTAPLQVEVVAEAGTENPTGGAVKLRCYPPLSNGGMSISKNILIVTTTAGTAAGKRNIDSGDVGTVYGPWQRLHILPNVSLRTLRAQGRWKHANKLYDVVSHCSRGHVSRVQHESVTSSIVYFDIVPPMDQEDLYRHS